VEGIGIAVATDSYHGHGGAEMTSPSPTPEPGDDVQQLWEERRQAIRERDRLASELAPLRELAEWLANLGPIGRAVTPEDTPLYKAINRARTALGRTDDPAVGSSGEDS
jgi:hypothetical protein